MKSQDAAVDKSEVPFDPKATVAGFTVLDIFERENLPDILARMTRVLGKSPDVEAKDQSNSEVRLRRWDVPTEKISEIFGEAAKVFDINIRDILPFYTWIRVYLLHEPTMPFGILAIRGGLDMAKLSEVRRKLSATVRTASIPFRLFMERLPVIGNQISPGWSPRTPVVSWVMVIVDESTITELAENVRRWAELIQLPTASPGTRKSIVKKIRELLPLSLVDDAFPFTSHFIAFSNIHVVLGQIDQPGIRKALTPSLVYLISPQGFLLVPEQISEGILMGLPPYADVALPWQGEGIMIWLVALNLWASYTSLLAIALDREVGSLVRSVSARLASKKAEQVLSDASKLGSRIALIVQNESALKRRSKHFLEQFLHSGPLFREIPVFALEGELEGSSRWSELLYTIRMGTATALAKNTQDVMEQADHSLRAIGQEISEFQRHVSDLATIEAREESRKLNRRIEILTWVLVVLTVTLVSLTALLALAR